MKRIGIQPLLDRKTECRSERRERTMLKTATEGNRLVIYLEGSVDSLNATEMGKQIREAIQAFLGMPWLLDAQNCSIFPAPVCASC